MIIDILFAGLNALKEYIALHVLTCLTPAFLLAGAVVTFVSRQTIIGYLGAAARKLSSFGIAAGGSFFIAACSCTVIPVSSLSTTQYVPGCDGYTPPGSSKLIQVLGSKVSQLIFPILSVMVGTILLAQEVPKL